MQHLSNDAQSQAAKVPWNKGRIIGARPPLQTKHVWSIRTKLQMDRPLSWSAAPNHPGAEAQRRKSIG
jgi:hypothetical protein